MTERQKERDNYSCASTSPTTSSTTSSTTNSTTSSTNQQYKQDHIEEDHHNNNYYNNPNGAGRALPEIPEHGPTEGQLASIREAYEDNIGPMTKAAADLVEMALSHGLTVPEVLMAIDETGMAPRPTAWYLKAILENWVISGVTVSKVRHEVKRNKGLKWWRGDR